MHMIRYKMWYKVEHRITINEHSLKESTEVFSIEKSPIYYIWRAY